MSDTSDQWKAAEVHLNEILIGYAELIGKPYCNPWFAISSLRSLMKRYEQGERTEELLKEMQEAE